MTGGSYFSDFSIFDGDPNGQVFRDYTAAKVVPDYSHHKLTAFEFVDGVNAVNIKDIFNNFFTSRTDFRHILSEGRTCLWSCIWSFYCT